MSGEMIRIMCSGSSATSATAARMMCGAWVVMYTVSLDVARLKSAIDPQHSIGDGCERGTLFDPAVDYAWCGC